MNARRRHQKPPRISLRPGGWIAIVAALLLLFAQQAAHRHMAGHLGEQLAAAQGAGHGPAAGGEDDAHHGAESQLHPCVGCLSLAGLDMPLASPPPWSGDGARAGIPPLAAVPPRLTFRFPAAYRSRAPPRHQA